MWIIVRHSRVDSLVAEAIPTTKQCTQLLSRKKMQTNCGTLIRVTSFECLQLVTWAAWLSAPTLSFNRLIPSSRNRQKRQRSCRTHRRCRYCHSRMQKSGYHGIDFWTVTASQARGLINSDLWSIVHSLLIGERNTSFLFLCN